MGVSMQAPFETPKRIEINKVDNGFTVALMGGKTEKSLPFRHNLHIAQTVEQVVDRINSHLSDE